GRIRQYPSRRMEFLAPPISPAINRSECCRVAISSCSDYDRLSFSIDSHVDGNVRNVITLLPSENIADSEVLNACKLPLPVYLLLPYAGNLRSYGIVTF